ncbi:MAG: hypothetical protein VX289_03910, partial [Candidatus Poribacteria bacterium]|nr:hypothetical protein [Candidatus Poribacteria bacterium]
EGTVPANSVTFSTTNFNTAQAIIITGVDDLIWDGNINYSIVLGPATSVDATYNGVDPPDLSVINYDDEVPGLILNPTSGLSTGEGGATDKFTVMLNFQPSNDVNVTVSCSDATECGASPSSLTFTSTNWNTTQTVNVSGDDDDVADGDVSYIVTTTTSSDDPNFNGVIQSISGTNSDDDIVGIMVSSLIEIATSETGARSTFELVLESEPTSDVQIAIFSSDLTEAAVAPAVVIFSPNNWDQPRIVTVSGLDDEIIDPDEAYEVVIWPAVSTDASYNGIDPSNLLLTNIDDEVAGVRLTPQSGLSTTEMGGSDTLTVNLTAKPAANVNISITTDDESEGTVFPSSMTFTSSDWDTSQQVIVTGEDDDLADGDIVYNIVVESSSADLAFNVLSDVQSSVTNINDDPPGISIDPVGGLETTETGGTATFKVVLLSGPSDDVSFNLSTSNPDEGEISDSTLIFKTTNWSTEQTVTVSGIDDKIDDGEVNYTVVSGKSISSDPNYNDLTVADVELTNIDDDSTGFDLSAISDSITTEAGGSATFTVSFLSQPIVGVVVSITSSDTTEGVLVPGSIVFTDKNWNTVHTATVTGFDDDIDDGDIDYTIKISSSSNDPTYSVLNDTSISFTNSDDDLAGLTISGKSGLVTTEAGGDTSITVMLNSEPISDVLIVLTSSDSSEGLPDSDSLRFTPSTWDTKQDLKVVGQQDYLDDGDVAYNITGVPRSIDEKYNSLDLFILSATNTDNDSAAVNVTLLTQPITNEDNLSALLTIGLNSEPTSDVTITVTSSDESEGKVTPKSIMFSSSDWAADTITVTGQQDFVDDGDVEYEVVTSAAVSEDINYSDLDPPDLPLTNLVMLFEVPLTSLDFGEVRRDSSKTLSIPITNLGKTALVASDINFTNNYFFSDDSTLEVIAPSKTYQLNVTFNPVTLGDYLDTLELSFNLNLRDNPILPLRGKGVKPTISSSTTDLDFGLVLLNEPRM